MLPFGRCGSEYPWAIAVLSWCLGKTEALEAMMTLKDSGDNAVQFESACLKGK